MKEPGKRKRFLIFAGITLLGLICGLVGWFILPETLVMQYSSASAPSEMHKIFGLLIPFLLIVPFGLMYCEGGQKKNRNLVITVVGLLLYIPIFLLNL